MIKTDLVLPYRYDCDTVKTVISERLPIKKNEIKEIRILKRELVIKDGKTQAAVLKTKILIDNGKIKL